MCDLLSLAVLFGVALHVEAAALNVSVPLNSPTSQVLYPALVSLSIEQDLWNDWSGTSSKNSFFYSVLGNLNDRAGEPPWIRIGGNSEDRTNFNPQVQYFEDIFPAPTSMNPYPEANSVVVGDGFYESVSNLYPGTHVMWGINLKENNITAAYSEALSISKAFSSAAVLKAGIVLDFVEIGNEADLYTEANWSAKYIETWTSFAANISSTVNKTSTKFLGGSFALLSSTWSPTSIIEEGILDSAPGSLITAMSVHHYSSSFCSGISGSLQDLMLPENVRTNLSMFQSDIATVRAKGLDYILGETNSYSCHGAPGVSNVAGTALWMLNYALYAGLIGISRVHFHGGVGYKYNLIQPATLTRSIIDGSPLPTPLAPHIQPMYYAALIAAEAIGPSRATTAVELSINDTYISGYAFYEYNVLKRVLLVNSQAYFKGGLRTTTKVNFTFLDNRAAPQNMSIKTLQIGYADDTSGLTWGGQSFETSDAMPNGTLTLQFVAVEAGVEIEATEAILITFL